MNSYGRRTILAGACSALIGLLAQGAQAQSPLVIYSA